jgi:hypothetical protein
MSSWDFGEIDLHHVGRDQRSFIEAFLEHVLPRLRGSLDGEADRIAGLRAP